MHAKHIVIVAANALNCAVFLMMEECPLETVFMLATNYQQLTETAILALQLTVPTVNA